MKKKNSISMGIVNGHAAGIVKRFFIKEKSFSFIVNAPILKKAVDFFGFTSAIYLNDIRFPFN